jgi:hypothetical protein
MAMGSYWRVMVLQGGFATLAGFRMADENWNTGHTNEYPLWHASEALSTSHNVRSNDA